MCPVPSHTKKENPEIARSRHSPAVPIAHRGLVRLAWSSNRTDISAWPSTSLLSRLAGSDDPQMRAFIMWQIERAMVLSRASGVTSDYLTRLRTAPDAATLRQFMHGYFGPAWTHRVLGL